MTFSIDFVFESIFSLSTSPAMAATNVQRLQPASPRPALAGGGVNGVRAAMKQLVSGVCIVTIEEGEERKGLTVTSVSSLSAEPPTLLVCAHRELSSSLDLARCSIFAVNVLAADQRELAQKFLAASRLKAEERVDGPWLRLPSGISGLAGSVAVFDCEVEECIERHNHIIVIGRIQRALLGEGSGALVCWQGAYDQVGWSREEISRAVGLSPVGAQASDQLESLHRHLRRPNAGPRS